MKRPRLTTRPFLWALPFVALLALSLPKLGQGDFNVDTGHYSAIALQAWRGAAEGNLDWLASLRGMGGDPAAGGTYYFNKPPAAFWIHGLVLWAFGPSVFAARVPSVLAAGLVVFFTMLTVHKSGGSRGLAVLAGLVLALTPEFVRSDRAFSLDLWQLAGIMACVAGVVASTAVRGPRSIRGLIGGGVGLGFALLIKPLVALVALPLLGLWLLLAFGPRRVAGLALVLVVALIIAAPWHVAMYAQHGAAFTDQYLGRQIVDRARGLLDMNDDAAAWWYYARVVATSWWPWLLTFVLGVWALLTRGRANATRSGAHRALFLALLWIGAWAVLLSCFADKRPRYLVLVQPFVAWVSAWWLLTCAPRFVGVARRAMVRWAGPVFVAGAVVVSVLPMRVHTQEPASWTAARAFLQGSGRTDAWAAGLSPMGASRVYLGLGWWPRPTLDYRPAPIPGATPAPGAMLIYERRAGLWTREPGPTERVLFQEGDVTITEFSSGALR